MNCNQSLDSEQQRAKDEHHCTRCNAETGQSTCEEHTSFDPASNPSRGLSIVRRLGCCIGFNHVLIGCAHRTLLAANTVLEGRRATEAILRGDDDRIIVVVGYVLRVPGIAHFPALVLTVVIF